MGSSINLIASTNFGRENSSTGIGGGPTPLAWTLSPQKGWSPKKGTIVVGHYQNRDEDQVVFKKKITKDGRCEII